MATTVARLLLAWALIAVMPRLLMFFARTPPYNPLFQRLHDFAEYAGLVLSIVIAAGILFEKMGILQVCLRTTTDRTKALASAE